MQQFIAVAKALSDENRVRIMLALRDGELCLCQLVEVLDLAPSTVSKHTDLLRQAGLITRRKQGRWHYFGLAEHEAAGFVQEATQWVLRSLASEQVAVADAANLCGIRETDLKELAKCYIRS